MQRRVYGAEIVGMRRDGKTLQEIGDYYGVTRERIRQVLRDLYPGVKPIVKPGIYNQKTVSVIVGISTQSVAELSKKLHLKPWTTLKYRWYDSEQVEIIENYLRNRKCKVCGRPLLSYRQRCYCIECCQHRWRFSSEKRKAAQKEAIHRWQKNHPDRVREIARRCYEKRLNKSLGR